MLVPVKKTPRNLPAAGPGRPKGVPNKVTTQLKEAILEAATAAGGKDGLVGYLTGLAKQNQPAFAGLLGKVLPLTLVGDADNPLNIKVENISDTDRAAALMELLAKAKEKP